MATILFYSSFNNRSRDTESLMMAFKAQGHVVISLTQSYGSFIHPFLTTHGIVTISMVYSHSINLFNILRHSLFLISFCKREKVDVVYSHLESANFVAALSQYFIRARVYVCRHHADMFAFRESTPGFSYWLTYKLAHHIIVVSQYAKDYMAVKEHIFSDKIQVIPLSYNFELYPRPNMTIVDELTKWTQHRITLVTIGQLVDIKRPEVTIQLVRKLVDKNLDVCLFMVGQGDKLTYCQDLVKELNLADRVIFSGYVLNVMDYLACSHILIHPSISESSCVVVKEAALLDKPVVVCEGVGDFSDYIKDTVNGFLLSSDSFIEEAADIIYMKHNLPRFGLPDSLKSEVETRFGIHNVIHNYESLNRIDQ